MRMTMEEIREHADMAETWPGSGVLNWGEIGWLVLADWVTLSVDAAGDYVLTLYDVESVKGCFERWWKSTPAPTGDATREG
jgi:hypothetical protein